MERQSRTPSRRVHNAVDTQRVTVRHGVQSPRGVYRRSGFTLLDLLVSVSVIGLLLSLVLPVMSRVSEATKRVMCRSNIRQVGITLSLYAENNSGRLPQSVFAEEFELGLYQPQEMLLVRTPESPTGWDGLGHLYDKDYVSTPPLFYCPSHRGGHRFDDYEDRWYGVEDVDINTNYHYRAITHDQNYLHEIDPSTALVADGMRTVSDFNHRIGTNVLRADLSVHWFDDTEGLLLQTIPAAIGAPNADLNISRAWWMLETGSSENFPGLPWSPTTPGTNPSPITSHGPGFGLGLE